MSGAVLDIIGRTRVRYWALGVLVVSLFALQQGAKAAEPVWVKPPVTLSPSIGVPKSAGGPSNQAAPKVRVDSKGGVTTVWLEKKENAKQRVHTAYKAPGASSFGPSEVVSSSEQDADYPDVATDDVGNVTLIWIGSDERVYANYKPAGGTFGQPQQLSNVGVKGKPKVVADDNGRFAVAWIRKLDPALDSYAVEVSEKNLNGLFTAPVKVSQADALLFGVRVATNSAGDTALTWIERGPQEIYPQGTVYTYTVKVAYRQANGQFGSAQAIQSKPDLLVVYEKSDQAAEVAVDPQGRTYVAWNRFNYAAASFQIKLAVRSAGAGGTFGSDKTLDTAATHPDIAGPRVVVDGSGNATVTWHLDDKDGSDGTYAAVNLVAALVPASGGQISYEIFGKDFVEYDFSVDSQGNAYVVWIKKSVAFGGIESRQVRFAYRPVGQEFGESVALSSIGQTLTGIDLAVTPDGYVAADWKYRSFIDPAMQVQASWKLGNKPDIDRIDPGNDENWPPNPKPIFDPAPVKEGVSGKVVVKRSKGSAKRSKNVRSKRIRSGKRLKSKRIGQARSRSLKSRGVAVKR